MWVLPHCREALSVSYSPSQQSTRISNFTEKNIYIGRVKIITVKRKENWKQKKKKKKNQGNLALKKATFVGIEKKRGKEKESVYTHRSMKGKRKRRKRHFLKNRIVINVNIFCEVFLTFLAMSFFKLDILF